MFFRVHGKRGLDDLDVMHDQLKDDGHVEVFLSNEAYVEHQ